MNIARIIGFSTLAAFRPGHDPRPAKRSAAQGYGWRFLRWIGGSRTRCAQPWISTLRTLRICRSDGR
jgi:hypothetical protein